jgi:peptidoglycan/xylan/chitin deacetylase (PgdA/CDA1 family)
LRDQQRRGAVGEGDVTGGSAAATRALADAADSSNAAGGAPANRYVVRGIKCLVSLAFWCLSETGRILLRSVGPLPPAIATVVYYHRIQPHERQWFAHQLDHLCKWVTPIAADPDEPLPRGAHCTAITFDDGWQSFAETAFAELEQRKIPVSLFAVAGRLGRRLEQQVDEPLVSEVQLEELATKGVTIGSHTLTHCRLTQVDEATALYELRESRRILSQLLKREVTLFSFPFSQSNDRLVKLCREAGYRRAFTGQPCVAYSRPAEFETGRVRVDPADWKIEFHLKLMGAYRWLPAAFALKSRLRRGMQRAAERRRLNSKMKQRLRKKGMHLCCFSFVSGQAACRS